ncbi:MAG TPA: hypothetical protein V6C78_24905 [Crinalium sp.]|jgi:hypothetical protein
MSQDVKKAEGELTEDQLESVAGGQSERFVDAREANLDKAYKAEGELTDEQLKTVAGGQSERFVDAREENLDSH